MKKTLLATKKVISQLPKPTFENFKGFNDKFNIVHDFFLKVAVIIGIATLLYYLIKEISSNKYILTTVEVAHAIEETKDESSRIYQSDFRQNVIREIDTIINIQKDTINQDIPESFTNDPTSINISGFDLNQVFLYFRSFFRLQNREIKTYISLNDTTGKREGRYSVLVKIGTIEKIDTIFSTPKEIVSYISKKIIEYNSPYKLGLFLLESEKLNKLEIDNIIGRLSKLESNESLWEKIFQKNYWKEKRCSLEAMMFVSMKYNENSFKEKIRKYYQYPNENNCTSLLCVIDSLNAAIRDYNIELHKKIGNLQKKIEYDSTSILDNKYEIDTLKNKLRIDSLQKNILKTDVLIMTNKTAILSLVKQINLIKYPTKITYNNKKYSDWE